MTSAALRVEQEALADGRRLRGAGNRRRIVDALLKLVAEGNISPSAEQVALEAGVALRTVFRHFADMESLRREISERVTGEIRPIIDRPFTGATWRDRMNEVVDRRAAVFERVLPFRIAGAAHQHRSSFLTGEHDELVVMQRAALEAIVPPAVRKDRALMSALDLVLSLESWIRLRTDQKLSPRDAKAAVKRVTGALLAKIE